jgi:hypothetical protein
VSVSSDEDKELLGNLVAAIESKDFFTAVLVKDIFDDWFLVKQAGEFLVRIEPESEIMGHALLLRAHRHLGNRELAFEELRHVRERISNHELGSWEKDTLRRLLGVEEKLLSE